MHARRVLMAENGLQGHQKAAPEDAAMDTLKGVLELSFLQYWWQSAILGQGEVLRRG